MSCDVSLHQAKAQGIRRPAWQGGVAVEEPPRVIVGRRVELGSGHLEEVGGELSREGVAPGRNRDGQQLHGKVVGEALADQGLEKRPAVAGSLQRMQWCSS